MKRLAYLWVGFVACAVHANFRVLPLDIFSNDAETRSVSEKNDLRWTVYMGGCTGSMLSTKYMLTANHCSPAVGDTYTSGGCLELKCRNDLKVVRIAETSRSFDYTILEVEWNRKDSRWRQRYPPMIQTKDADITLGKDGVATELFTVGFPGDRSSATHARGYAKSRSGNFLQYNVGSINGNSGGAVWTTDTYMLVSQTNHGPHQLGESGWKGADAEDSSHWNGGPRMNLVYDGSKLLQELFPSGVNSNVSFEGYLLFDSVLPPSTPDPPPMTE